MAKKKQEAQGDKSLGNIESALTRTELFIENNQKMLTNILFGVLVIVLVIIAGNRFILQPRSTEAATNMYMAEKYFEQDSFAIALNGYGTYPGFLEIIEDYSFTKSARLAKFYAGISYKELGDFENAIDFLSKFNTRDGMISSVAKSALGDCYSELNDFDRAIKSYMDAINSNTDQFTTPIILKKAGIVAEAMGDNEQALELYNRIEKEFPDTAEGRDIKKYIGRVEAKLWQQRFAGYRRG